MTRCTRRMLAGTLTVMSAMLLVAGIPLDARAMPVSESEGASQTLDKNWYDRTSGPIIFFAVLEGLYGDGVAKATVGLANERNEFLVTPEAVVSRSQLNFSYFFNEQGE